VLADGLAVYTPGLSDHRSGASTFTHADALGSLRFLTSGQTPTASLLSDAFGEAVASDPLSTPFGWNGGSGYGADRDGLTLVGHRYYDARTGRFLSQDPAGDGDNWYAYAGNDPVNGKDPSGLLPFNIDGIDLGVAHGPQAPGSYYDTSGAYTVQGVYQVWTDKQGNVDPSRKPVFLYNIAYPNAVDLGVNLENAMGYDAHLRAMYPSHGKYFNYPLNDIQRAIKEGKYFGGHVGHTTVGDFKNKITNPLLYTYADNGGNFNAGMIGAGIEMGRSLLARSGDYARTKDSGWVPQLDDRHGARVLQDGYTFGLESIYGAALPGF
jgi:RHS repeat-associated protein